MRFIGSMKKLTVLVHPEGTSSKTSAASSSGGSPSSSFCAAMSGRTAHTVSSRPRYSMVKQLVAIISIVAKRR
jgi:hypothetical protein